MIYSTCRSIVGRIYLKWKAKVIKMAAAAGNKLWCHSLLLVAVLVIAGDAAVGAGACSPPTTTQVLQAAEQLQGLRQRSDGEAPAAAGDGGLPAAPLMSSKEQMAAAAGAGGIGRMPVGSRAPTCTYNECRGCRHRCSVRVVPIDASNPINSAYHYKCVCHL